MRAAPGMHTVLCTEGKRERQKRREMCIAQCNAVCGMNMQTAGDHMPIGALLGICFSALAAQRIGRHNVWCNVRHNGRSTTQHTIRHTAQHTIQLAQHSGHRDRRPHRSAHRSARRSAQHAAHLLARRSVHAARCTPPGTSHACLGLHGHVPIRANMQRHVSADTGIRRHASPRTSMRWCGAIVWDAARCCAVPRGSGWHGAQAP